MMFVYYLQCILYTTYRVCIVYYLQFTLYTTYIVVDEVEVVARGYCHGTTPSLGHVAVSSV